MMRWLRSIPDRISSAVHRVANNSLVQNVMNNAPPFFLFFCPALLMWFALFKFLATLPDTLHECVHTMDRSVVLLLRFFCLALSLYIMQLRAWFLLTVYLPLVFVIFRPPDDTYLLQKHPGLSSAAEREAAQRARRLALEQSRRAAQQRRQWQHETTPQQQKESTVLRQATPIPVSTSQMDAQAAQGSEPEHVQEP